MKKNKRVPDDFRGVEGVLVSPCVSGLVMQQYVGKVILAANKRGQIVLNGVDWGFKGPDECDYPKELWKNWNNLVSAENRGQYFLSVSTSYYYSNKPTTLRLQSRNHQCESRSWRLLQAQEQQQN